MQTRSYANSFEIQDYSEELVVIPNTWTILDKAGMGLFKDVGIASRSTLFDEQVEDLGLINEIPWGFKGQATRRAVRKTHQYAASHYAGVDYISVRDIDDKRARNTTTSEEAKAVVLADKLQIAKKNMMMTRELARCRTLFTGNVYSPSGLNAGNFYTDFGVTRKTVDFVLGTPGTNMVSKVEEVIAHIQDNQKDGSNVSQVLFICSPEWFTRFIAHNTVITAYQFFSTSGKNPLRERLAAGGSEGTAGIWYRTFEYAGALFVEYRQAHVGQRFTTVNEAVAVPMGTDGNFITYNAPAEKFQNVGALGEEMYLYVYPDVKGEKEEIEYETNFIHTQRRPACTVQITTSN